MIAGLLSIEGQKQRESGFRDVLRERYPLCRLASVLESGESAERAGLLALQVLKENPAIRGVYHASAGALEVVKALRALGREKDVVLITHELTAERRALLQQRAIDAIIDQNPEDETRMATETMARFLGRLEGEASSVITSIQIYTPGESCLSTRAAPRQERRRRQWRLPTDHVGGFLGDHDRRRVGVARGHKGHHRGVDDAQTGEPTQAQIGRRHGVGAAPHRASSHRMVVGLARAVGVLRQLFVTLEPIAGQAFGQHEGLQRRLAHDLARQAQAVD